MANEQCLFLVRDQTGARELLSSWELDHEWQILNARQDRLTTIKAGQGYVVLEFEWWWLFGNREPYFALAEQASKLRLVSWAMEEQSAASWEEECAQASLHARVARARVTKRSFTSQLALMTKTRLHCGINVLVLGHSSSQQRELINWMRQAEIPERQMVWIEEDVNSWGWLKRFELRDRAQVIVFEHATEEAQALARSLDGRLCRPRMLSFKPLHQLRFREMLLDCIRLLRFRWSLFL